MTLRKIAFVLEDFTVGSPGQQLLDRFLIGYFREGEFRRIANLQVAAWLAPQPGTSTSLADTMPALAMRQRDFNLVTSQSLAETAAGADALVVVPAAGRVAVGEKLLREILEKTPAGTRCFIHGCLATNFAAARRLASLAADRGLHLAAATSMASAFRLPELEIEDGAPLREGLILVQGARPAAELAAMDGLLPLISRRAGGETGLEKVRRFEGRRVWKAGDDGDWSWPLLAAAISRSNTTQGDPVLDGRTQDLAGRGLIRHLARNPRAWVLQHRDGFRSAILVLDGVVADCNFAVRSRDGTISSAQLYRPPPPNRSEFDRLAGRLEDFFQTGKGWTIESSLVTARFMEQVTA